MAKQTINIGTAANDGTGESIRSAFDKVNQNTDELYANKLDAVVIHGSASKTTLVDADEFTIVDSEDSNKSKKVSFANVKKSSFKAPTRQVLTSGSTYTTPTNPPPLYIRPRGLGAGGGGAGGGTGGGTGGAGGNTTFGTSLFTANGGNGGAGAGSASGGAGGVATGGSLNLQGGSGGPAQAVANGDGGFGAAGPFGGQGNRGTSAGAAGAARGPGSGGGGGGNGSGATGGGGGGAGGYFEGQINSPAATYSYAVGAAGTAGTAGTNGNAGAAGAAGIIIVDEFYQ